MCMYVICSTITLVHYLFTVSSNLLVNSTITLSQSSFQTSFCISIIDDTVFEDNERFYITLRLKGLNTRVNVSQNIANIEIIDDDGTYTYHVYVIHDVLL